VVRAAPDGHTLLLAGAFNTINTAIFGNVGFDFVQDLAPVAGLMRTFYVVVVHPSVPVRSLAELITYARANPGRLNMASGGNGGPHQIAGEQFKMMTGVDLTHVPYRGTGPALNDMVAGHAQVMFDNLTSSLPFIRDGKLRALAVTSPARTSLLPDVPTAAETVPGYEPAGWVGVCAPRATPPEIVTRLNGLINAGLEDASFASRLGELGGTPMAVTPAGLGQVIAADTARYRQIVAFATIRPD
jgi:tripartite-type tricarboxylate transporter receptor subunit TctC